MQVSAVFDATGIDTSFQAFAPTCTDGYKIGHAGLYPAGTNFTYGNGTPRSDRLFLGSKSQSDSYDNKVVWAGIQGVMREVHGLWQRTFLVVYYIYLLVLCRAMLKTLERDREVVP